MCFHRSDTMCVLCISLCAPPLSPLWKWEIPAMSWTEWAPGVRPRSAAWLQGREYAAVRHPSGSRRGRKGQGEQASRSSGQSPPEMRPRSRRRRRKRRRSRTGSLLLRPASWPPLLGSFPPVWQWCHWGHNRGHLGSPGDLRFRVPWSAELMRWGFLSAALHRHSV